MEKVPCHEHGSLCLLKTGLRDGPNQGKSFYVCTAELGSPCGFTLPVDLPASHCLQHGDFLVELQALVKQEQGNYKLYYRCLKSKAEGTRWCGHVPWQSHKPRELPRNDKSEQATGNHYQPKPERNPFKVLNENLKQISEEREEKRMEEKQKDKERHLVNEKTAPSESWRERDLPVGMKVKKTYERKRNDLIVESTRSEKEIHEQLILKDGHTSQAKLENAGLGEHRNYLRSDGDKVDSVKQLASNDYKQKDSGEQGAIASKHRGSEEQGAIARKHMESGEKGVIASKESDSGEEGLKDSKHRDSGEQGLKDSKHRDSGEQGLKGSKHRDSGEQGLKDSKHRDSGDQGLKGSKHRDSGEQGLKDSKHRDCGEQGLKGTKHRDCGEEGLKGSKHRDCGEQGLKGSKHRDCGEQGLKDSKHRDCGEQGLKDSKHRDCGEQGLKDGKRSATGESSLLRKPTKPQEDLSSDGTQRTSNNDTNSTQAEESCIDGKHRMAEKQGFKAEGKSLHSWRGESSREYEKEGRANTKEGPPIKAQPNGSCETGEAKAGVDSKPIKDQPECDRLQSSKPPSEGTMPQLGASKRECTTTSTDAGKGGGVSKTHEEEEVMFVSSHPGKGKSAPELAVVSQSGYPYMQTSRATVQRTITSFPGFGQVASSQESAELHNQLKTQLKQKKATLATVNVQALPDKGQRLVKQVQDLEDALSALSLSTPASLDLGIDVKDVPLWKSTLPEPCNRFSRITAGPPSNLPLVKPLYFQNPRTSTLGLQGLASATTLGSSQHCSQVYGVNPQWQGLYGGRMTEDRLYAVHNATSDAIGHLHKSLESCPAPESTVEDPPGLKVPLLLHQKQALAWLLWREAQKPPGGILADDMGLGKTLTMIALILAQKRKEKVNKDDKKLEAWISKNDSSIVASHGTLIICPASLIHHWKKEVERRVSGSRLRVYIFHGPNRERDSQTLSEYDIVVTTYSLVSKEILVMKGEGNSPAKDPDVEDKSLQCSTLLRIAWARVILDEAHNIKNPKVQTSIAVCKLRAGTRWAVTGTPIQNNLLDMYSLLKFLRCSPFDEFKLWKSQVDNGSKKGGERLNILTKSLLLRRTKDQLDSSGKPLVPLPQRHFEVHRLKLSEDEQSVYNVLFARSRSTLQTYLKRHEDRDQAQARRSDNPFDRVALEFGAGQQESQASSQQPPVGSSTVHILSLLLRLRQCCCHLALLKMSLDQLELKNEGITLSLEEQLNALTLSELNTPDPKSMVSLNGTSFQADLFENTTESSKISCLLVKLKAIRSSPGAQKSVVVSQWTSMLKIVAVHLQRIGMSYATIDGSVNPKLRMDMVEEFNTNPRGPQVMLVSLCAGGVGLNLIGGNHLFLLDMHWNPALEDQACDRIYRVGQLRNVVIHRFVCEETVEEKISELQDKKKELAKKVLSGTSEAFTKLTLADLRVLFGV